MDECARNKFCASLSSDLRDKLCAHCTKRRYARGQILYRADLERWVALVVDGVLATPGDHDDDLLDKQDRPAFAINTSGVLLGTDSLFVDTINPHYEFIHYECLSDATVALFSRAIIRELFESSAEFAKSMYQSLIVQAAEISEFAALLRIPQVERSVKFLINYCYRKGFKLTQAQMAQLTGHDRSSVARAIASIKKTDPVLWRNYATR